MSVFFIFGLSSFSFSKKEEKTEISLYKVSKNNLTQSLKVLGKAELVDEQKLRFNQKGKIQSVYFKDGQNIKKNDLIAELDKTDVFNEIKQAEISLQNSNLNLKEILKGNKEAQILKAENSVRDLEKKISLKNNNLVVLKKEYQTEISNLENELKISEKEVKNQEEVLKTTEKELETLKISETENLKNSYNNYDLDINNAYSKTKENLTESENILNKIDKILGIEDLNKNLNDEFEDYLGATNQEAKDNSVKSYKKTKKIFNELSDLYQNLKQTKSIKNSITLLEKNLELLENLIETTDFVFLTLQNSVTSSSFTFDDLESFKNSISSTRNSSQNYLNQTKNTLTNIKNIESLDLTKAKSNENIRKKEDSLRTIQISLEKAKNNFNNLKETFSTKKENKLLSIKNLENEINSLKDDLKAEKENLKDIKKGETEEKIKMAKNDILQKQLKLAQVKKNIENYELRAPFEGIIRKIDFKVGDNLITDEEKFVYIENPNLLKITILLDQIDVVKVSEGNKTEIVFDAIPEKTFLGKIEEINKTPIIDSGVVSYEASITLNKDKEKIYSGMTASIKIIIDEKKDVLTVPVLSLINKNKKTYIEKVVNNKKIETEIKTGFSDGKNIEVLSGLKEGDFINKTTIRNNSVKNKTTNDQMRQFMRATR